MYETTVTLVGKVVGEIAKRRYENDTRLTRFRLMSKERRYDPEADKWVDGHTMFVSVNCWRRLGENVAVSLSRGDYVVVTGRLYHREYESENQQRLSVELDAVSVGPDLSRCATTITSRLFDDQPLAAA
ncbi:single-stranded DNA-binding protein [Actinokineospora iranica]|uniref:Single-stranded DNA-binding protein n=1 Tax=Actinokineospora iranica TaxID=1271860 RepID=A0A1G6VFQ0_9PSEU|nr:single-stranded DNA-binding protein [Actinokineospora iranica]SDD51666.1 single-strand DNA-binding protein [Actinokineospora iranica]